MIESYNYYTWIPIGELDTHNWCPAHYNPVYRKIDQAIADAPDSYVPLSKLVEISTIKWEGTARISYIFSISKDKIILNRYTGEEEPPNSCLCLPAEAILVGNDIHYDMPIPIEYWNERYFSGKGIATRYITVLKPKFSGSIAWLVESLKSEFCQRQLIRLAQGLPITAKEIEYLLSIQIPKLDEISRNKMIEEVQEEHQRFARSSHFTQSDELDKLILTGSTFEERMREIGRAHV